MIERFWEQYRWLSNFWEAEIKFGGITYPTVEHYYVAMKIDEPQRVTIKVDNKNVEVLLDVQQLREYISELPTPGKAKSFGKEQLKGKERKDWDDVKNSVMEYGLKQKYSQEPLRTKLIETGDEYIQEGNTWDDTYWGVNIDTGEGKNVLGKMIMNIRKQLNDENNGC